MSKITLTLKSLECKKSNETGKDELFVMVSVRDRVEHSIESKERFPKNEHGFWHIGTGDSFELNEELFSGDILRGLVINLKFMEEDKTTGTSIVEPLAEMIDDFVGAFKITVESSGKVHFEEGKHSKIREKQHKEYHTSISGSGAEYHLVFEVK